MFALPIQGGTVEVGAVAAASNLRSGRVEQTKPRTPCVPTCGMHACRHTCDLWHARAGRCLSPVAAPRRGFGADGSAAETLLAVTRSGRAGASCHSAERERGRQSSRSRTCRHGWLRLAAFGAPAVAGRRRSQTRRSCGAGSTTSKAPTQKVQLRSRWRALLLACARPADPPLEGSARLVISVGADVLHAPSIQLSRPRGVGCQGCMRVHMRARTCVCGGGGGGWDVVGRGGGGRGGVAWVCWDGGALTPARLSNSRAVNLGTLARGRPARCPSRVFSRVSCSCMHTRASGDTCTCT